MLRMLVILRQAIRDYCTAPGNGLPPPVQHSHNDCGGANIDYLELQSFAWRLSECLVCIYAQEIVSSSFALFFLMLIIVLFLAGLLIDPNISCTY